VHGDSGHDQTDAGEVGKGGDLAQDGGADHGREDGQQSQRQGEGGARHPGRGLGPGQPAQHRPASRARRRQGDPGGHRCYRITGGDGYLMTLHIRAMEDLEPILDRFRPCGRTTTSIVHSAPVPRRALPLEPPGWSGQSGAGSGCSPWISE
jgi:hypothetical protein